MFPGASSIEENFPDQFGVIHSNKSQNYRLNTMASFQAGEIRGIITTDVMARGLDISDVTHVINFEFTDIPEQYIHRIGRTGRADDVGAAGSPHQAHSDGGYQRILASDDGSSGPYADGGLHP